MMMKIRWTLIFEIDAIFINMIGIFGIFFTVVNNILGSLLLNFRIF